MSRDPIVGWLRQVDMDVLDIIAKRLENLAMPMDKWESINAAREVQGVMARAKANIAVPSKRV